MLLELMTPTSGSEPPAWEEEEELIIVRGRGGGGGGRGDASSSGGGGGRRPPPPRVMELEVPCGQSEAEPLGAFNNTSLHCFRPSRS